MRRPGIYELPPHTKGISAQGLLNLAGGQEVQGPLPLLAANASTATAISPWSRSRTSIPPSTTARSCASSVMATERNPRPRCPQHRAGRQLRRGPGSKLSDILRSPGALVANPVHTVRPDRPHQSPDFATLAVGLHPGRGAVLRGAEDISLQSNDVVRPISLGEAELLSYIVKTYLDKLNYDQNRVRNPLDTTRADAAAAMQAASSNAAASAMQNNNSVSPNNPFGLQPSQLESDNFNLDDFSGVPTDMQRSDIVALLNVAAPGTPLADQRQAAYQQALATATSGPNAASSPVQMAQAQQSALAMSQYGVTATDAGEGGYSGYQTDQFRGGQQGPNQMSGLGGFPGLNGGQGGSMTNGPAVPAFPNQPPNANFEDQPSTPGSYASNQEGPHLWPARPPTGHRSSGAGQLPDRLSDQAGRCRARPGYLLCRRQRHPPGCG